jgi:transcriptional activator for dhaKLM operon
MQPTIGRPDLSCLQRAWREFIATACLIPGVDPLIAVSWQRCAPRLNPTGRPQWVYVSDEVFPLTLNQHASLRAIASPLMEDIHQFMEGAGAMLLLSDSTDCVLEIFGDRAAVDYAAGLGLRRGVFLDESHVGTNAVAVAILERCPAQVVGPEHFLSCFHNLSTIAAPIFDLDGRPVGVIGMMAEVDRHSPHALGVMTAAARAIENQLRADRFIREANTGATELNATLDAISEGVLAWTAEGIITHLNHQAGGFLGLSPTAVVGRPLVEYMTLPEGLSEAVARGEELNDVEAPFAVNGGHRECLASLRIIRNQETEPVAYIATLRRIEQVRQLVTHQVGARARMTLDDIVGHGAAARRVRRRALSAADAKGCVLLVGESGTNKNPLARAIHNTGRRARGPFLAINCRAIPRALALGEFLGFEPGAFNSGPTTGQPSKFELAHGGTLFLEAVDALALDAQSALLGVIESGEVIRLGGRRVIPVDARVIASTETDLEARVAEGTFRADLFFRLSSFTIALPPLRDRPEDIPLLLDRLLERLSAQLKRTLRLTASARRLLSAYPWPGNVRELESVMERAALHCEGNFIRHEHLPESVRKARVKIPNKSLTEPVRSLAEAERFAILVAGHAAGGKLTQTANILGIGRTTLWRKMKQLAISPPDFPRPRAELRGRVS